MDISKFAFPISGWANKLPPAGSSPIQSPAPLLETGQIGVLKTYDCRNTGNPLLPPPTDSGALPCLLRGPWSFNGKSAYYPRLTLASPDRPGRRRDPTGSPTARGSV